MITYEGPRLWIGDTITHVPSWAHNGIVVAGSHCGRVAIGFAAEAGVWAAFLHDAGVGKERSGIAGLDIATEFDMPAGAVSHVTARIGSGTDVYTNGVIAHVNRPAWALGVREGMAVSDATELLRCARQTWVKHAQSEHTSRLAKPSATKQPVPGYDGLVVVADSVSLVSGEDAGHVVITGSHGGLVEKRAIDQLVRGAIFNDAGLGKCASGISRLPWLEGRAVPGATVAHWSARIGDAWDSLNSGVISHCNRPARERGVERGMPCGLAVGRLASGSS